MSKAAITSGPAEDGPVIIAPEFYTRPADPEAEPFLLGNECPDCGKVFFPARAICPTCFQEDGLNPRQLSGRGRVHASTVVRVPSPIGIPAPYASGYVDLDEAPVRIFALFGGAEPEWFVPGRPVRAMVDTVRLDPKGRRVIGYKFRPAERGQDQ